MDFLNIFARTKLSNVLSYTWQIEFKIRFFTSITVLPTKHMREYSLKVMVGTKNSVFPISLHCRTKTENTVDTYAAMYRVGAPKST